MLIKAIFFDIDGVLTRAESGFKSVCQALGKLTRIDTEKIILAAQPIMDDYYKNKISKEEFWKALNNNLRTNLEIVLLDRAYEMVEKNTEVFELVKKLKEKYKVGIISNNPKPRFEVLRKVLYMDNYFDFYSVSGLLGEKKQSGIPFSDALSKAKCLAQQAVLIDNSEEVLEQAAKLGFRAVFYSSVQDKFEDLKARLKKAGVEI